VLFWQNPVVVELQMQSGSAPGELQPENVSLHDAGAYDGAVHTPFTKLNPRAQLNGKGARDPAGTAAKPVQTSELLPKMMLQSPAAQ